MTRIPLSLLPEHLRSWHGTAAQLATRLNDLLPLVGLDADAGSANERLIRYYVAEGLLSEPESRGRERLFGFTQIMEYLAARQLIKDGWPLAKIGELIRSSSDIDALVQLGPATSEPTAAERALARIREQLGPKLPEAAPGQVLHIDEPPLAAASLARDSWHARSATDFSAPTALERAAGLLLRRSKLRGDLKSLGNPFGRPDRRRLLRISLTPWCQVLIDARHVKTMDSTAPRVLGDALANALEEERVTAGDKN